MPSLTCLENVCERHFLSKRNNFASHYTKNNIFSSNSSAIAPNEQVTNYVDSDDDHDSNNSNSNTGKPKSRVLIVDDEPDILQVFKLALEQYHHQNSGGFLVDVFTNPKEALQSFKSNAGSYSLMITDVKMPELSGIQLSEKVKEINPNVKVVLTTAFEMKKNELSKLLSSALIDGFMQKPIGIEEVNNKILSIMRESKNQ